MKTKTFFLTTMMLALLLICSSGVQGQAKEKVIKTAINDYVYCWNNKDMAKLKIILNENFTRTVNGVKIANNEKEMEAVINDNFTAFPDVVITVDNTIIKDNQSFGHWTFTGTNTGKYGENPPTGKKVNFSGYSICIYDDAGKLTQEIVYFNELALMQQLGYTITPPVLK